MTARAAARPDSRLNQAIALSLLAMLAFAVMDAISKVLAGALSIPQILWVRYILFTALAVMVLRKQGLRRVWHTERPWLQAFRAALLVIENGVFVLAFKYLPLADVHAIAAASPLIVIALSSPILGEQVGPRRWLAVIVGFLGVLLIVRPGFQEFGPGIAIALLGAVLWGLYQILMRLCAKTDASATTWLWSAVIGLLLTTVTGPSTWVWPDARGWLLLAVIAALGSVAHLALIRAFSLAEAGALQPFGYTMLLWAAVIGYLAFGDVPDRWTLTGAAIIMASGLYAWNRERVRARAA